MNGSLKAQPCSATNVVLTVRTQWRVSCKGSVWERQHFTKIHLLMGHRTVNEERTDPELHAGFFAN